MSFTIDLDEYAEGAILLDGLEEAIIGIVEEFGNGRRILYSKPKILSILCERDLMTMGEAEEFYDYNILGLHAGEQNAVETKRMFKVCSHQLKIISTWI